MKEAGRNAYDILRDLSLTKQKFQSSNASTTTFLAYYMLDPLQLSS